METKQAQCLAIPEYEASLSMLMPPKIRQFPGPLPQPPGPQEYAPGQSPQPWLQIRQASRGTASWRPHFGRHLACFMAPHPERPPAQTGYAEFIRKAQAKGSPVRFESCRPLISSEEPSSRSISCQGSRQSFVGQKTRPLVITQSKDFFPGALCRFIFTSPQCAATPPHQI
eukprot:1159859-Pelagomonas_calceolata.AAC.7